MVVFIKTVFEKVSMIDPIVIEILTKGLTASLGIILGAYFFKSIKHGIVIPIVSYKIVTKRDAFIFFIISVFIVGYFSSWIEPQIKNLMIQNGTNLFLGFGLPLIALWFIFNKLFY
ncbi:MAG: hypothetical protein HYW22_01950 [Candidatus Aenigmarchaeota archaeon]|nr:hypothetical protein [Candidatus Aenigmarchaeota archaeon]